MTAAAGTAVLAVLAAALAAGLAAGALVPGRARPGPGGSRAAAPGRPGRRAGGAALPPGPGRGPEGRGSPDGGAGPASALDGDDLALVLDLAATLLESGLPLSEVLRALADAVPGCAGLQAVLRALDAGLPWDRAWDTAPPPLAPLGDALAFTRLTGAATATVLRASATERRRAEFRAAERRAAELGVRLVVPLGACALPAFVCLGIVPLVIALLPGLG